MTAVSYTCNDIALPYCFLLWLVSVEFLSVSSVPAKAKYSFIVKEVALLC
jgi:hypothetical protein